MVAALAGCVELFALHRAGLQPACRVRVFANIGVALCAGMPELTMDGVLVQLRRHVQVQDIAISQGHGLSRLPVTAQAVLIADRQVGRWAGGLGQWGWLRGSGVSPGKRGGVSLVQRQQTDQQYQTPGLDQSKMRGPP